MLRLFSTDSVRPFDPASSHVGFALRYHRVCNLEGKKWENEKESSVDQGGFLSLCVGIRVIDACKLEGSIRFAVPMQRPPSPPFYRRPFYCAPSFLVSKRTPPASEGVYFYWSVYPMNYFVLVKRVVFEIM